MVTFYLETLVTTTLFQTAGTDLLMQLVDTTAVPPLQPGEDQLPAYRDVEPQVAAVVSDRQGAVRNASPQEVCEAMAAAGERFTVVKVRTEGVWRQRGGECDSALNLCGWF